MTNPCLLCQIVVKLSSVAQSDLLVAIAAIHRSAFSRLKWYLAFFTTLSTHCGEHLTTGSVATVATALRFPRFAAGWTALGLIGETFGCIEFLLASTEGEGNPTVRTLQRFIHKAHRMTSFLSYLAKVRSSKACGQRRRNQQDW